jgi:hypothetical protein
MEVLFGGYHSSDFLSSIERILNEVITHALLQVALGALGLKYTCKRDQLTGT